MSETAGMRAEVFADLSHGQLAFLTAVLLEYFENEDFEALRGEELRLARKVIKSLEFYGLTESQDTPR